MTQKVSRLVSTLLNDLQDYLGRVRLRLCALETLLDRVEYQISVTKTGFYTEQERRLANDAVCALLSEHETLLPHFQRLASELLAFDGRILEIDVMIDRAAALRENAAEKDPSCGQTILEQTARICRELQPSMTRFCFTDLPNFRGHFAF